MSNVDLNVPVGSVSAYEAANVWSGFKSVEVLSTKLTKIAGLEINSSNGVFRSNLSDVLIEVYSFTGKPIVNENLSNGIYVVISKNNKGQTQVNKLKI